MFPLFPSISYLECYRWTDKQTDRSGWRVFVQRSRREPWTSISKCVSVCVCVTYSQASDWSKVTLLYHGGGYWGEWAWRGPYTCCYMKLKQIREGWAELYHTQTFYLGNLCKSQIFGLPELCHPNYSKKQIRQPPNHSLSSLK